MASYQTRQREPLVDPDTQAVLERRGRELVGVGLLALALVLVLMLASYSPDDPGWMVATEEPAQNRFGWFGAGLASTLMIILGLGAWSIPLILAAWGLRFVLHRGEDRAIGRIVFAVIGIALTSVFAATSVPGPDWPHSFSLGGLFGDTVLGAVLGFLPVPASLGLKLITLFSGVAMLAMLAFVTGFDRQELRAIGRFLLTGSIMAYAEAMTLLGHGARGAANAASALRERRLAKAATESEERSEDFLPETFARREPPLRPDRLAAMQPEPLRMGGGTLRADARFAPEPAPAARERTGLLARMQSLARRLPEAELVEPDAPARADLAGLPSHERISARISDLVRARAGQPARPGQELTPLQAAIAARRERASANAPAHPIFKAPAPALNPASAASPQEVWPDPDTLADQVLEDDWEYTADPEETAEAMLRRAGSDDRRGVVQQTAPKAAALSRKALAEAQPRLLFDDPQPAYELPPLSLLSSPTTVQRHTLSNEALEENARMLESVLDDYGVKGEIIAVRPGPVVTMYELEPAPGLKASRVIGLADDIARSMSALSARVSTVPGRTVIGIELPNVHREKVVLREILSARDFGDSAMRLPLALGKDIGGDPIVANLAKMPHLLIAGTTGSGKSVAINTMILSLLYKLSPEECRLIMIDPKMLELSVYDGIPHLLSPVVTDPKKAVVALKWVVGEMEERYRKMSKMGVRNIEGYNGRVREALAKSEMFRRTIQTGFDDDTGEPVFETEEFAPVAIPYIVVVVDEMADLMMVAGKEIEACIQRLAQMARDHHQVGHLVLGHPPHHGHPAPLGRCDHRHDQGELPDPHLVSGHQPHRQPHHPGRAGRRTASGHGRHALHGRGCEDHPHPRAVRFGRGG
jgi:DNA segregation ATPase FtsK/SpoIIIE, S-DNA-T family